MIDIPIKQKLKTPTISIPTNQCLLILEIILDRPGEDTNLYSGKVVILQH